MTKRTEIKSLTQIINESGSTGFELREMMGLDVDHLDSLQERYTAVDTLFCGRLEIADRLLAESLQAERDWANENAELAFSVSWQPHQISRQINSDCSFSQLHLVDYRTGDIVRPATIGEFEGSRNAGVIAIDGYQYYVQ